MITLLLVAATLVIACGKKESTGPSEVDSEVTIADLAGTWNLIVWEYSLAADTSEKVDWVDLLELTGTMTIAANGDFTVTPRLPSGFGNDHGTLTVQADSIYWDGEDDEEWVQFDLSGINLTLHWPEAEFLDMDMDSNPEDVYLRVVFRRSS